MTQRIRLETFLKNNTAAYAIGGWTNLTETRIVRCSGVLNITDNVNSIYQISQFIIFVDGDGNVMSNITRIDAWIIAAGALTPAPLWDGRRGLRSL